MIDSKTPRGLPVLVPENDAEDKSPKFAVIDSAAIRSYYEQNGYVIVRGIYDGITCDAIRHLWDAEVKPYDGYIYRQATARAERHQLNSQNWVMNPILNLQSVDPRKFPGFREFATSKILTATRLAGVLKGLFGEAPKFVQSMYFEGNSKTWEHQDTYYLDSCNIGAMCAAWIALEDISADAGRFFVCPGSHKISMGLHGVENNIADNHEVYIQSVVKKTLELGLEIRAPRLGKGDVLFWNSKTIHGSLDSQSNVHSRSSITCHAIPQSHDFLQLQTRRMTLKTHSVNGLEVFCPKDQRSLKNRAILWVESRLPTPFYFAKKMAIRYAVRRAVQHNVALSET